MKKALAAAALGASFLTGTAFAFSRRSAPAIVRRSSGAPAIVRRSSGAALFASPAEFAKSEIASQDVSVDFSDRHFCLFADFYHPLTISTTIL